MHDIVSVLDRNRKLFAIVRECSRDREYPVYIGGSLISYSIWESVFGIACAPDDIDLVFYDVNGDFRDEVLQDRVRDCTGLVVNAHNQACIHKIPKFSYRPPRTSLVDAVTHFCDTSATIIARLLDSGEYDVIAPYGYEDVFSGRIRTTFPEFDAEVRYRARNKPWLWKWPQLRVYDSFGVDVTAQALSPRILTLREKRLKITK